MRLAYLSGSRATGRDRPESDIDVAFLVDERCVRSPSAVNRTIRHFVEGVSGGEIRSDLLDVTLLNGAPVLLCHRVLWDGLLLHARDETERVRFAVRTMREYQDFAPWLGEHARRRIAERLRAWAGFRNVLVHGYANLDHRVAWRAIQDDLGDLRAFKAWAVSELDSSA